MAAPTKKRDCGIENNVETPKRRKLENVDENLEYFLHWCQSEGFVLNSKVAVTRDGSCAQYGMVANENIEEGETLFEIPRSALLTPETSDISQILLEGKDEIKSESGWVPLLLALMYEYSNDNSKWRHYVNLVPDFEQLDLPMFWNREELESELLGTGIVEAVDKDFTSISNEFSNIVLPFVNKHKNIFQPICNELEFYKKMVSFVMAYSFTEPEDGSDDDDDSNLDGESIKNSSPPPPMMVPLADILNHVSNNNAHLVFQKDSLRMVATKVIRKGDEVYNTYGELANWQLLQMYGFSEPPPSGFYNMVDLPMTDTFNVISKNLTASELLLLQQKWNFLKGIGCVSDDGAFVIGESGVLTEEAMYQTLRVLVMNSQEFEEHKEKEGWSSDDDDDESSKSLAYADITSLPHAWKDILTRIAVTLIEKYPRSFEEEKLLGEDSMKSWTKRQIFSSNVRTTQLELLIKLKSASSS